MGCACLLNNNNVEETKNDVKNEQNDIFNIIDVENNNNNNITINENI